MENSKTTYSQEQLDGNSIPVDTLEAKKAISQHWGIRYEDTPTDPNPFEWQRIIEIPNSSEVEYHFFTDSDRRTSYLWTAEEAGQSGQRAADLSVIHSELPDVEQHFYRAKYAKECFDQIAHPDDWDESPWLINEAGNPGDQLLVTYYETDHGNTKEVWVSDFGDDSSPDWFSWTEGCPEEFTVLDPENHPVSVIHSDMMREHTDPITIASHEGVYRFHSRGGVMWKGYLYDDYAPDWAWEMAAAKYRGSELPDTMQYVGGGWHSSMEDSQLSEFYADLTNGDFHDNSPKEIPPIMWAFGGTGNVCSVSMKVYTTPEFVDELKELISGKRAAPGYAGLRA